MMSKENKNLIMTYVITLVIAGSLIFIIFNFNNWFFPNDELKLSQSIPASRGIINEKDLRFDILSNQKFRSLEPILNKDQLSEEEIKEGGTTTTTTTKPSTRPPIELRRGNPFQPF